QIRGITTTSIGPVGPINPVIGSLPSSPDLSVGGTVNGVTGNVTNAVPIEGLYDRATNAVTNTVSRTPTGIGNAKDQLGKNLPQPRPSRVPPAGERRFVATEVLVALPSNLTPQALDTLARRHRLARL